MKLSIIVAAAQNGVIGANNDLPWHLPADLQHFKRLTTGKPVIMGRKTWESLPVRPLPGRLNIVVTGNPEYVPKRVDSQNAEGVPVVANLHLALERLKHMDYSQVFAIGGARLFKEAIPLASDCYLTDVRADISGDVYFPSLPSGEWKEISRESHESDARHAYAYDFVHLQRVA